MRRGNWYVLFRLIGSRFEIDGVGVLLSILLLVNIGFGRLEIL